MSDPAAQHPARGPNCWDCRHLAITWDARMPYGCKLMGFRSRVLPSMEVLRNDGRHCGGFSVKVREDQAQTSPVKPLQSVEDTSLRQKADLYRPFTQLNLII